jgi:flagellar motor component MotA
MNTYIYPENLKATANLWLWSIKDFVIIGVGVLLAVLLLVHSKQLMPAVIVMSYAFLTIRLDDTTILDFLKYAVRFFISTQQYFEWRL